MRTIAATGMLLIMCCNCSTVTHTYTQWAMQCLVLQAGDLSQPQGVAGCSAVSELGCVKALAVFRSLEMPDGYHTQGLISMSIQLMLPVWPDQ